jgi:hypothetical protein
MVFNSEKGVIADVAIVLADRVVPRIKQADGQIPGRYSSWFRIGRETNRWGTDGSFERRSEGKQDEDQVGKMRELRRTSANRSRQNRLKTGEVTSIIRKGIQLNIGILGRTLRAQFLAVRKILINGRLKWKHEHKRNCDWRIDCTCYLRAQCIAGDSLRVGNGTERYEILP